MGYTECFERLLTETGLNVISNNLVDTFPALRGLLRPLTCVKALLNSPFKYAHINIDYKTPIMLAEECGAKDCADVFRNII